jgi:hypothetical protein
MVSNPRLLKKVKKCFWLFQAKFTTGFPMLEDAELAPRSWPG